MKHLGLFLFSISVWCQTPETNPIKVDSLYREDQFYIGIQYSALNNRPSNISQDKISLGFNVGILRDFPINKQRSIAIAPGIGYSFKNYNSNLGVFIENNTTTFSEVEYSSTNYLRLHSLDFPIELRWRSSTPDSHKFWRTHLGFKLSKVFYNKSYYSNDIKKESLKNIPEINDLTYSVYTALGWNTWNIYISYGLKPIFTSNNPIVKNINSIDMGFIFYIL